MSREWNGKVVVVTGFAGALGQAVADSFQREGATVVGLDLVEREVPYRTIKADLTNAEEAGNAFGKIGSVDVLANIAGGFTMGETVAETSDETWEYMMNLNARTVLNAVRAVVPGMKERHSGKIINVGARNGLHGHARMAAYSASKSVVVRLTESLSEELRDFGINVNCVLPSIIDTERNRADMPKSDFSKWVAPEALARIILFLASSDAQPIHGAAIPVDGLC